MCKITENAQMHQIAEWSYLVTSTTGSILSIRDTSECDVIVCETVTNCDLALKNVQLY